MITVKQALAHLFELAAPLPPETVPLRHAAGRILAQPVVATRDQPPFAASAMDGYAVARAAVQVGATFKVVGESAAGHRLTKTIAKGEAARIFTGAPMPDGTDFVIIQEDVTRNGDTIILKPDHEMAAYVRPAGADFRKDHHITAPRLITPNDVALLASMNVAQVPVTRKPIVAIIATGDELVHPGEAPSPDQIIASNSYGLAALLEQHGAQVRMLPIARDRIEALDLVLSLTTGADLVITIGGASVGDHDLVAQVAERRGMQRRFYKVAMRPGKPLMAGRLGTAMMIGLPGNPVSAMVCGHIFVLPVLRALLGLPKAPAPYTHVALGHNLPANGPREHYMRGVYTDGTVSVFERQDSALLTVLADANVLVVRPPSDPERAAGEHVKIVNL